MQVVISPGSISGFVTDTPYHVSKKATTTRYTQFINWCIGQEQSKMLWMALTFLGLIGMTVPVTLASIVFIANNNFALWILVCAVNVPVMVISLTAQPTKVIIPSLAIAVIIDVMIILYCITYSILH